MATPHAHILTTLHALSTSPRMSEILSCSLHQFRTYPVLTEEAIRHFENAHGVALPVEYRNHLLHVGNGGAGPGWGLFKLGEIDDGWQHKEWRENDFMVGDLSEPFPHTGPWNDLKDQPPFEQAGDLWSEAESAVREEARNRWDEHYWRTTNVNGAIPICHLGCALRQWLVVTGPEAGHVWCDDRADYGGLYPLEQGDLKRVTFLRWYLSWLEEVTRLITETGTEKMKAEEH